MKKSGIVCLAAVLMMAMGLSSALAVDPTGKLGIGAEVDYYDILDKDIVESPTGGVEYVFDGEAMFGVSAAYFLNKYCSLKMGINYVESTFAQSVNGREVSLGDLQQIPVLFTVRAHYPTASMVSPYVGIGLGYYFNEFDIAQPLTAGFSVDAKNELGFHVTAGLEAFLTDCLAVDVDVKYVRLTTDMEYSFPTGLSVMEAVDMDAFSAGLSIKYYFDAAK